MNFNIKVREARLENNLTQKELAESLKKFGHKVSNTSIANWESGLNKPDIDTLSSLCKILNKKPDYFIQFDYNDDINHLISNYNKLNSKGQQKALEAVEDYTEIKKYTK